MAFFKMMLAVCGVVSIVDISVGEEKNVNISAILDSLLDGYDKRFPPKYESISGDKQVDVNINIYIASMFSISEMNMDYSMSMFLRERWVDERLAFNITGLKRFELSADMIEMIWIPDVYILNEKKTSFNLVTVPNKMVHIYPDGTVQISMRVTGAITCLMFLQKYPFDTQYCGLELESYSKSTESLKFHWTEKPVTVADGIRFPQFDLVETKSYNCEKDYFGIYYPCVGVSFKLERDYSYHIVQVFIPSILIVGLSWVNFWLDAESVPARISLGLLTVLTMTTQTSGVTAKLPMVSYVKSIDVWMAVCLAFVFLGLVEFAYVNVQTRVKKRKKNNPSITDKNANKNANEKNRTASVSESEITLDLQQKNSCCSCSKLFDWSDKARSADKLSRIIFPLTFLIFNIVYWVYYMLWDPELGTLGAQETARR